MLINVSMISASWARMSLEESQKEFSWYSMFGSSKKTLSSQGRGVLGEGYLWFSTLSMVFFSCIKTLSQVG